ncbi:prohead protease/major capsid protein fusion protein [Erythrobacter rubeus]|uniref:HK97 family phage prohead protease n=1 Tax=Erythrobacter rubeus TaxID=2760803 RepID=A0ABR8KNP3_9SPHN|nr:prohead protease/major capsid protein fusion protein [Erythrobacter rubeus]MBD2842245.1 HK97 family phage prohead protease [Erythrobacter rubeus]
MPETLDLVTRRAETRPTTWNEEALTVEAVLSTGAPVQRRDALGPYVERLDLSTLALSELEGVPLLDGHRQSGSENVVGIIQSARREGEALVGVLRLSAADDAANVRAKVGEGTLRGVSVGYAVSAFEDSTDSDTGQRVRTATAWRILEVSLVAIPADPSAKIRSHEMPDTIEVPSEDVVQTRTAIREIARTAGLEPTWADEQIDNGADVTAARAAAFEHLANRETPTIQTQRGPNPDHAVIFERRVEGLAARMGGAEPSDEARPYANMALIDQARSSLQAAGVAGLNTMSREEILHRALHTTSDFPNLLTASGNRVLMPAYQAASSPIKRLARKTNAPDFRPLSQLKIGEFGKLDKVNESGEIKGTTTSETIEGYRLETFGRIFGLSRQAIINDDLAALGRWASMMGQAAAETEADQLISLITESNGVGPVIKETGNPLFDADHGNLASVAGAPSVDTLSAARLAMRMQKGLGGDQPINVTPKYLVIAPDLETTAEKVLAELRAATVDEQNPFSGRLELMVEARLPETAWYVFADPATVPVLEYAYLSSAQGPQLSSRDGWEVLGREFRVTLDFGCGAVDYRGAYRNAGA